MKRLTLFWLTTVLLLVFFSSHQLLPVSPAPPSPTATVLGTAQVTARVVKVVDGDTIKVEVDGVIHTIRYIGIDAPESVDPRGMVECFGKEAAEKNRQLVENATVTLEKDVSDTDKYGRWLRYVYKGGVMINQKLVAEGYSQVATYPPDVKYQQALAQAQQKALEEKRGLWASCFLAL